MRKAAFIVIAALALAALGGLLAWSVFTGDNEPRRAAFSTGSTQ
jgi:hypothetical protein